MNNSQTFAINMHIKLFTSILTSNNAQKIMCNELCTNLDCGQEIGLFIFIILSFTFPVKLRLKLQ